MLTGKLVRWNDDKGFGFIHIESDNRDVFIHISALTQMSRRPVVGDAIFFQIQTDATGKSKAVNANIEGVPRIEKPPESWSLTPIKNEKHTQRRIQAASHNVVWPSYSKVRYEKSRRGVVSKIIPLLIVAAAISAYDKFSSNDHSQSHTQPAQENTYESPKSQFQCEGKTYCSQMSSCEEATFYIRNCPGTKMDGNHDGIPCERQWCN